MIPRGRRRGSRLPGADSGPDPESLALGPPSVKWDEAWMVRGACTSGRWAVAGTLWPPRRGRGRRSLGTRQAEGRLCWFAATPTRPLRDPLLPPFCAWREGGLCVEEARAVVSPES